MLVYDCENIPTAPAEVPRGSGPPLDRRTFTRSIRLWLTAAALPIHPTLFATDVDAAWHVVQKGEHTLRPGRNLPAKRIHQLFD